MPSTGDDDGKVVQFPSTPEERRERQRAKQAAEQQRLVDLFVDEAGDQTLFHTANDECYADLIVASVRQTLPIRSKRFRAEYVRYLQRRTGDTPLAVVMAAAALRPRSINEAIDRFELKALSSPIEREVHVRVARDGDHLYIDLGDPRWSAVRITADGWTICESPPVRFRRTPDTKPLPYPERGGSIAELRQFLPSLTDDDFTLVVAWLLAALQPDGPYPVLAVYGEHGLAKTGGLHVLRAMTDPHRAPTTPLPSSARDLFIAARNSHVLGFGNLSKLSDAMSDNLCRLSSGGAMRTRKLFSDNDETTLVAAKPLMLEGIANYVVRPDLIDRALVVALESPPGRRRTERELWAEFEQCRPRIFGALCDMLAAGVRRLPETRLLSNLPRMADFATWGVACGVEGFEAAYARNRQAALDVVLEHDLLARSVEALMADRKGKEWRGAANELLDEIGESARISDPKTLSDRLRRLAQPLRTHGISITHEPRTSRLRGIIITRE